MKKLLSLLVALVLSVSLAAPAFAADTFVPSITYKDAPEISSGTANGEKITAGLVVVPVSEAQDENSQVAEAIREQLVTLYEKLDSGEMKLPVDNTEFVIRDLVAVTYSAIGSAAGMDLEAYLATKGNTVTVDFDLGVSADAEVIVMVYVDDEWVEAENVTNNGNGTVSVVFETLGATAFCVKEKAPAVTPEPESSDVEGSDDDGANAPVSGNVGGQRMLLWCAIMAGSVAALLILIVLLKRSKKEEAKK